MTALLPGVAGGSPGARAPLAYLNRVILYLIVRYSI